MLQINVLPNHVTFMRRGSAATYPLSPQRRDNLVKRCQRAKLHEHLKTPGQLVYTSQLLTHVRTHTVQYGKRTYKWRYFS